MLSPCSEGQHHVDGDAGVDVALLQGRVVLQLAAGVNQHNHFLRDAFRLLKLGLDFANGVVRPKNRNRDALARGGDDTEREGHGVLKETKQASTHKKEENKKMEGFKENEQKNGSKK